MQVSLEQVSYEITEDTAWTQDQVGLSSGDIYLDNKPFGHYVAAWYPNTARPLQKLVTAVDDSLKPVLSIGFKCNKGCPDSLTPVEPAELPWDNDGILFGPVVLPQDIDTYNLAHQSIRIAPEIIRLDNKLYNFVYQKLHNAL